MKRDFCTFFDKNYLSRGLALYYSITDHYHDFTLFMLCIDNESFELLKKLNLKNLILLRISEIEDDRMRTIKSTRTPIEYSWLFSSQLPLYLLQNKNLDMITYLDADMCFFDNAEEIYREFDKKSILIIPHRYPKKDLWREKVKGIYNVGMTIFRKDLNALECLNWWKDRCLEWCYGYYEDGKFGDQLYLNDWPIRFKNVHVLKHLGANLASWNITNYDIGDNNGKITVKDKEHGSLYDLIFYHFHGFRIYMTKKQKIKVYPISIYNKKIYAQYLHYIQRSYDKIHLIESNWDFGCIEKLDIARRIKQYLTIMLTRSI